VELWHRLTDRAIAWVRKGPGRAQRIVRLLLLLLGLYLAARAVRAMPNLMWALTGWWCVAAWRAGKTPRAAAGEASPELDVEAVRTLLLEVMGEGGAVHLRTVLAHLQQHPTTAARTAAWTVGDLRARLEALDIPVRPKVKAHGGGPTRGVRREDLTPSPAEAPETSTEPSTAA
jgi:hypothetical protein